jgi:type IV fimbrial biogenesis protein FimT
MKKQTGMTLIELLISTIILVTMVSVAVPSMKSFFDRGNLSVIGPIFEKSVKLARTEAIQRSQTIRITPKSGNSDWSQGWDIEAIVNPDPINPVIVQIRSIDALPGTPVFSSNVFDNNNRFEIFPNGQASLIGDFRLHRQNCEGGKTHVYSLLLSGLLSRNEISCP